MTINFHEEKNRSTYATRTASEGWIETMSRLAAPEKKRVLDIGCGGGIYTKAWAKLGATEVIGIDFSAVMIQTAEERCRGLENISLLQADALQTGLPDQCADVVCERALIHHIGDLAACFSEAYRLLTPGGLLIVQDRTPEDVQLPGSPEHIRGYFFEQFPRLLGIENARRPERERVSTFLKQAGFIQVETHSLWEVRREYEHFADLAADLRERTGRSLLHELNDVEMKHLIEYIEQQLPVEEPIIEKDRWTIWIGSSLFHS